MQSFFTDTGTRAKIVFCEPGQEKEIEAMAQEQFCVGVALSGI